jgi:hypothetical protein
MNAFLSGNPACQCGTVRYRPTTDVEIPPKTAIDNLSVYAIAVAGEVLLYSGFLVLYGINKHAAQSLLR